MKPIILSLFLAAFLAQACPAAKAADPYDALYETIMTRQGPDGKTVGLDSPFPLIWNYSQFLYDDERSRKLIAALDAFNALPDAEIKACGAIKRALLQRQLWAVFDWTTERQTSAWEPEPEHVKSARIAFQKRIAPLLKRLALSKEEILALPDTAAATIAESAPSATEPPPADASKPFFPADLLAKESAWVCLGNRRRAIPAKGHTEAMKWRSAFLIFIRLPDGRAETLDYIQRLGDFHDPWVAGKPPEDGVTTPHGGIHDVNLYVNPKTPQFPVGTQFALMERAFLISDEGELVLSPFAVSIQLRTYLRVDPAYSPEPSQAVAEFVMQPLKMMRGEAAMRAIEPDEIHYSMFFTNDTFEHPDPRRQPRPRLEDCRMCHSAWGIHSVNSRAQLFEERSLLPPQFHEGAAETIGQSTASAKRQNYTWGLLEGLWKANQAVKESD